MADNSVILSKDANLGSEEPHTFPGMPGVYAPGEPVDLDTLGLDPKEAKQRIKDLDLPLEVSSRRAEREELLIPGRHYDPDDLAPGEAIPALPPAGRIHSSPEGWLDENPPEEDVVEAEVVVPEPEPEPEG